LKAVVTIASTPNIRHPASTFLTSAPMHSFLSIDSPFTFTTNACNSPVNFLFSARSETAFAHFILEAGIVFRVAIKNHDFIDGNRETGMPDFWNHFFPRTSLKPNYVWESRRLIICGNGNRYAFGCWTQQVEVMAGKTYRFKVRFQAKGIDDINLHVMNLLCWLKTDQPSDQCPYDHISSYVNQDSSILGEELFSVPPGVNKVEIQLGLRFSESGQVTWNSVELSEAEKPAPREAVVSVVKWRPYRCDSVERNRSAIGDWLDKAGALQSDLVLLPEFSNAYRKGLAYDRCAENLSDGLVCTLLREKALQYRMNVCAGIVEKSGDLYYSSAVLFNRQGELIGTYRKTHPFWPEEMLQGLSPGCDYPVFDLDFGKVGIVICYDNWYGEIHKLLALRGAELLLVPNEAYEPLLMHARALDNRVYVAASSLEMKAMIVNTKGRIMAETNDGMVSARIDLNDRRLAYPYPGGTLNHSSGGRRGARNSLNDGLYEMLAQEMRTWENRPEGFFWYKGEEGPALQP
jgi:predicted amidohydrolase